MRTYRDTCLIGSIDYDQRRKYGALNTSNKWKSRLDRIWNLLGNENSIPDGLTERERYWWIYTNIREGLVITGLAFGVILAYMFIVKAFAF